VGGFTASIKDTTAVSTSPAYTAGDAVGGLRTLANAVLTAGTGVLESITVLDRANQKAALEILIFDANPTAATITDNAAFVYSTDDLKVLARISVGTADYITLNSKAVALIRGIGAVLKAASGTSLYAAVVTTGTPTFAATTDVQIIFGILQD
jgi:DNA-binding phage protein